MRGHILLAGLLIPSAMALAQTGGSVAGTASAGVGGAVNGAVNGTRTTTSDAMARGKAGSGLRVDNRGNLVRPGASVGADAGGTTVRPATGTGADVSAATGATTPSAPPPR